MGSGLDLVSEHSRRKKSIFVEGIELQDDRQGRSSDPRRVTAGPERAEGLLEKGLGELQ